MSGWNSSGNGTDKYGFSVLPAGGRCDDGDFDIEGYYVYLCSASEYNSSRVWTWYFGYSNDEAGLHYFSKNGGRSLRCLKDS